MSETGDFESFSAPAASEASEESQEQFNEQMRAAQAAMAALQKEEGQSKAQDGNMAKIIVGFLNNGHTDLFLLISRCVGQNIPSELILAVLSLVDEESSKEVAGYLKDAPKEATSGANLAVKQQGHFNELSPEQKKKIDEWVVNIDRIAVKRPHRCLESLVVHNDKGREISPIFIQLSAFIMRNYFTEQKVEFEFDELYAFMQSIYVKLISHLEDLVAGQKRLSFDEAVEEKETEGEAT